MFIRKRTRKLKDGEESVIYQAVLTARKGDRKVRKAVSLGDYPSPREALDWERKCLERMEKNIDYPIDQYKEVRHSSRYNRPIVVSLPIETAKKKRIFWIKLHKKQKARVEELEKLLTISHQIKTRKRRLGHEQREIIK
ncbi:MAG: hypothetical protein PHP25_01310 [Candidatus Moranbacteria bacterium]|nr:hypothetical protein [Candidatus Moranbacteria bacterium]